MTFGDRMPGSERTALVCRRAAAELPELIGGDLPATAADALRLHLQACLPCRREAAALQRARAALLAAGRAPVAGVDDAWFLSMHRDITTAVANAEATAPARTWLLPSGLASAALALLAIGFWFGNRTGTDDAFYDRPPLMAPAASAPDSRTAAASARTWPRIELRNLGDAGSSRRPAGALLPVVDTGSRFGLAGRTRALRALTSEDPFDFLDGLPNGALEGGLEGGDADR
jgi:hypothetical protein